MTETTFTLIRTIKSRGGGDDDYDVCDRDKVIGRIVRHPQAPMEAPWFWAITTEGLSRSWLADPGYAVSREHALAQFRARWTLNDLVCHRVVDLPTPPGRVHRSLRSVQRPNLGHLEQPERREADLYALRQGCLVKPTMTRRQQSKKTFGKRTDK